MTDLFYASDADLDTKALTVEFLKTAWPSRYISLEQANKLFRERVLAKGVKVECVKQDDGSWYASTSGCMAKTHTALLIQIEEIEKDSERKVLEDLIEAYGKRNEPMGLPELIDRAKRLLGGE